MFFIHVGSVRLETGRSESELVLGPGDIFGEDIMMGLSGRCEYTATALDYVEMHTIDKDGFSDLFRSMPDVTAQVLKNAKRIQLARRKIMSCVTAPSLEVLI